MPRVPTAMGSRRCGVAATFGGASNWCAMSGRCHAPNAGPHPLDAMIGGRGARGSGSGLFDRWLLHQRWSSRVFSRESGSPPRLACWISSTSGNMSSWWWRAKAVWALSQSVGHGHAGHAQCAPAASRRLRSSRRLCPFAYRGLVVTPYARVAAAVFRHQGGRLLTRCTAAHPGRHTQRARARSLPGSFVGDALIDEAGCASPGWVPGVTVRAVGEAVGVSVHVSAAST